MGSGEKNVNLHNLLNSIREERMWSTERYGEVRSVREKEKMDNVLNPLFKMSRNTDVVSVQASRAIAAFVDTLLKEAAIANNTPLQNTLVARLGMFLKSLIVTDDSLSKTS